MNSQSNDLSSSSWDYYCSNIVIVTVILLLFNIAIIPKCYSSYSRQTPLKVAITTRDPVTALHVIFSKKSFHPIFQN